MMPETAPLYIMAKPPLAERQELERCRARHGLSDHYLPDRFHSTFLRLGDSSLWPAAMIDDLCGALASIDAGPFAVGYDMLDATLLRGMKGMRGAAAFHRALVRRLKSCGFALPDQKFWLHLSLAYKGPARTAKVAPISWLVEEFLLIRSDHGHEALGRWPLRHRQLELEF